MYWITYCWVLSLVLYSCLIHWNKISNFFHPPQHSAYLATYVQLARSIINVLKKVVGSKLPVVLLFVVGKYSTCVFVLPLYDADAVTSFIWCCNNFDDDCECDSLQANIKLRSCHKKSGRMQKIKVIFTKYFHVSLVEVEALCSKNNTSSWMEICGKKFDTPHKAFSTI